MAKSGWAALMAMIAVVALMSCRGREPSSEYKSSTGIEFVLVRAGSFVMGDNKGELNARPKHKVTLTRDFYLSKTEVTFTVWDTFTLESGGRWTEDFGYGRSDRPAIDMTWMDAVRFCNWLSSKEGLEPAYQLDGDRVTWNVQSPGYRLPTEAEWEYAAGGGALGEGFRYAGSNDVTEVAWFLDNADMQTHPVASKKANGLGLFDMTGNVREYCWDWSEPYDPDAKDETDPTGPPDGTIRSVRGGSYNNPMLHLQITYRSGTFLGDHSGAKGFRVARTFIAPKR